MQMLSGLRPKKENLTSDAVTGLTFALINIPQAMANALLATVNPFLGLYTLIIATPVGALFTGSVFMNVSTTSALSLAAGDALSNVPAADKAGYLAVLVLLVGVMQFLAGIFKLGFVVRFVSKSVMVGFITGIALLIILGQIGDLTGYESRFSGKILKVADTILNFTEINYASLSIGLLTIALIFLFDRTRASKISFVLALFIATGVVQLLGMDSVVVVGDTVDAGGSFTGISIPDFSLIPLLTTSAAAIAIIGLVQGAGVSQSYPNPDGKYPNVSKDFTGQGIANVATSFFQGIPAGGSMSGTAVTVNAGAKSRWANIFAGLFVLPLVLVLSDFIFLIPMPSLAGLLIVVGFQSLKPDDVITVWQTGRVPQAAMGLTLIATIVLPLQIAVFIGVAMSILLHVFQTSNRVRLVEIEMVPHGYPIEKEVPKELVDNQIAVIMPYGSLFFAAAAAMEDQLPSVDNAHNAVVVFVMRGRDEIGSTFIGVMQRYHDDLAKNNGRLMLAGVGQTVWNQLYRTGTVDSMGQENVFKEEPQIGRAINKALKAADAWSNSLPEEADEATPVKE